jgi:RNA polymerase sigma factor (sigma-70 family)
MNWKPPAALVAVCRREHPSLVEMLSLYCGDRAVAEELAQEALIRLCQHWGRVGKMEHQRAWVHRVAINLAHSHYRRRKAEQRARSILEARPSDLMDEADAASAVAVRQAIAALPHRQKAVLVLHYYADLTFGQIGAELQIPRTRRSHWRAEP